MDLAWKNKGKVDWLDGKNSRLVLCLAQHDLRVINPISSKNFKIIWHNKELIMEAYKNKIFHAPDPAKGIHLGKKVANHALCDFIKELKFQFTLWKDYSFFLYGDGSKSRTFLRTPKYTKNNGPSTKFLGIGIYKTTPKERYGYISVANMLFEFIYFMNIFIPYKSRILNIYNTNVNSDAFGETDQRSAINALAKFVGPLIPEANKWGKIYAAEMLCLFANNYTIENIGTIEIKNKKDGLAYEKECEARLLSADYNVTSTPRTGDFGADLVVEKDDLIFVIQCKNVSRSVGVKAVQEAVASRRHYNADYSVVTTEAPFTSAAIELASTNDVILSNLNRIVDIISYS
ncbi:MAG: hypothetical protein COA85_06915 [Robiginitomaculum sp.]|nr:MAG: hypothetical protein COA85_06915 [Robiginitomaculum sp.]